MFVYFDLEMKNCQRFPFSLPLILASQDHLQNSPRSPGRALRHFFCSAASDPSVLLTWGGNASRTRTVVPCAKWRNAIFLLFLLRL
jgi:hypothetical protein